MGSTEDPKDGGKVAGAVFGAVGVYAVRLKNEESGFGNTNSDTVLPSVLRMPGLYAPATEPWRNSIDVTDYRKRRRECK